MSLSVTVKRSPDSSSSSPDLTSQTRAEPSLLAVVTSLEPAPKVAAAIGRLSQVPVSTSLDLGVASRTL